MKIERKKRVFFVHGIRARANGERSFEALKSMVESRFDSISMVSYGYVLLPTTNQRAINAVIDQIGPYQDTKDEIIVVAYSNGAWASVQAMELGYRIDHLILISPALNVNRAFPREIKTISVFHSPGDYITTLGKVWRLATRILPWRWQNPHGFGEMGREGALQQDPRITNMEMESDIGHFFYKDKPTIAMIAQYINTRFGRRP